ncbi:MAG: acyl-CoA reductase [Bacteroidia bacterium]
MTIDARIKPFIQLGTFLRDFIKGTKENELQQKFGDDLAELIARIHIQNPWFTEENVKNALAAIGGSLKEEQFVEWISVYIRELSRQAPKRVAVIMAGNIPMVGFHDMLCVLLSGNKFVGKLSSDDKLLLPFITKILIDIEPRYAGYIEFTDGQIRDMDAVIATGSNNSARYFDHYFGKYPNIIRRNRNSVAVLNGKEEKEELAALGNDVFQYFGLGCRNVSKLFVPKGYSFNDFFESIYDRSEIVNNNKYANNYDYNKTVYLMSGDQSLLDNNFLLLKHDNSYASPIGTLFYEYYNSIAELNSKLEKEKEQIQCIVSNDPGVKNAIPLGTAQCPGLSDYADGVDTMKFLTGL